jgi:uncharacterized protein (UPF0210 family)
MVTASLKRIRRVKTCGYSGLMLPVLEDTGLAARAEEGAYSIQDLLLYSAVCGLGLDCVPVAGDAPIEALGGLLLDVAALAHRKPGPLTARIFPVAGKVAGERTSFSHPFLCNSVVLPLS